MNKLKKTAIGISVGIGIVGSVALLNETPKEIKTEKTIPTKTELTIEGLERIKSEREAKGESTTMQVQKINELKSRLK